jgi:hypothetical protein
VRAGTLGRTEGAMRSWRLLIGLGGHRRQATLNTPPVRDFNCVHTLEPADARRRAVVRTQRLANYSAAPNPRPTAGRLVLKPKG